MSSMLNHMSGDAAGRRWPDTDAERAKALVDCPAEIREAVEDDELELRGLGDRKIVGRQREVNGLIRRLERVTRAKKRKGRTLAQATVGAPGAGKSSIIETVQKKMAERGTNVIRINALDLGSPERFSNAVKREPPWKDQETWRRVGEAITTGAARALDEIIDAATTGGMKQIAKAVQALRGVEVGDMGAVKATLEAWRQGAVPQMKDVLLLLQNANDQGTVIIIDEGQELLSLKNDATKSDAAAIVLKAINDPSERDAARIWNVTMLTAGMQDTPNLVSGFATVEPGITYVNPLAEAEVTELITTIIREADTATKDRAVREWTGELVRRYGDWTRHAAAAGEAAKLILDECAKADVFPFDNDWARALLLEKTDATRRALYQTIIDKATKHGVTDLTQTLVMDALAMNGKSLSQNDLQKLLRTYNTAQYGKPVTEAEIAAQDRRMTDSIQTLTRTGHINIQDGRHVSPIPSLLTHLTTRRTVGLDQTLPIIEAAGLGGPKPPDDDPQSKQ